MTSRSLNLDEAAALLNIHRETLRQRARTGVIPGAKVGRSWVFLEEDLLAFLRGHYRDQICPSTNKKTARSGGYGSGIKARSYVDQLERMIEKKRSASTTRSRPSSGDSPSLKAGPGAWPSSRGAKSDRETTTTS